jgi:hypothetical protein
MSPVHNLFFALTFFMKATPHSGVGAIEQVSSQDLDYCAELITASALNGSEQNPSSRQRQCHAQLGRMSPKRQKCENIFGAGGFLRCREFFCAAT